MRMAPALDQGPACWVGWDTGRASAGAWHAVSPQAQAMPLALLGRRSPALTAALSLQARSLLYQFRLRPRIPCSLHDLCKLCGSGMWDSGYMPAVECTGHHPGSESCPYGGTG